VDKLKDKLLLKTVGGFRQSKYTRTKNNRANTQEHKTRESTYRIQTESVYVICYHYLVRIGDFNITEAVWFTPVLSVGH